MTMAPKPVVFGSFISPLRRLSALARLNPGVTLEQAEREVGFIHGNLQKEIPDDYADWEAEMQPLQESEVGRVREALLLLFVAVVFVLATWRRLTLDPILTQRPCPAAPIRRVAFRQMILRVLRDRFLRDAQRALEVVGVFVVRAHVESSRPTQTQGQCQ
jgi:hypothetical protein